MGGEYVVVGKMTNSDLNFKLKIFADCATGLFYRHCSAGQYQQQITVCPRCKVDSFPARSQAQQFMKKLYAFKNIQQLLKLDSPASKTRAKELSLENNFVTELTSLVIPNKRDEDVRVANIGGRRSHQDSSRMSQPFQPGIQTTSLQFGSISQSVALSRGYAKNIVNFGGRSGSRSAGRSGSSSDSRSGLRYNYSMYKATITTRPTTTTVDISSNCSITLYEAEYHTGSRVLITKSVSDISALSDKIYSVKVDGWCKWIIFSGKNFTGERKEFFEGENYFKRTDFGRLYLNAKSIRMIRL